MKRIAPECLSGPRAYFTAFDPKIVERSSHPELLKKSCERRLKILLLLKTHIVCAVSHLKSPVAEDIFRRHPFLLEEGHIVPALRDVASDIGTAFALSKDDPSDIHAELARFYQDRISKVVTWSFHDTTEWFFQQFKGQLENPDSVLRRNAKKIDDAAVARFLGESQESVALDRSAVEKWTRTLAPDDQAIVSVFRDLLYHISGARTVNCEGSLPQEEYLDFDLADLSQRRTRLSDDVIFWKLFVEHAFASLHARAIPVEILDTISFSDIAEIRRPLLESSFQSKYDEMVREATRIIRGNSPQLLENVEKLDQIRASIEATFRDVLEIELPILLRKKKNENRGELASNSISVGLGVVGLVPGIGTLASAAGLAKDSIALYFNIVNFHSTPRSLVDVAKMRDEAIRTLVKRLPSEDTPMYDIVRSLSSAIQERIKLL